MPTTVVMDPEIAPDKLKYPPISVAEPIVLADVVMKSLVTGFGMVLEQYDASGLASEVKPVVMSG